MSALFKLIPNISSLAQKLAGPAFHSLTSETSAVVKPGGLFDVTTRNVIRCHFPRPSERKRIKRHGWKRRMSTPEGRRILMNRILKGRWVFSH